jgi:hypothetical protein
MTPNQLANVRRLMKAARARKRDLANLAADKRDAAHFDICARARRDGMRPADHATGYATASDATCAVMS